MQNGHVSWEGDSYKYVFRSFCLICIRVGYVYTLYVIHYPAGGITRLFVDLKRKEHENEPSIQVLLLEEARKKRKNARCRVSKLKKMNVIMCTKLHYSLF